MTPFFQNIFLALSVGLNIGLGSYVLYRQKKTIGARAFFAMALALATWGISQLIFLNTPSPTIWAAKLLYFSAAFIPSMFTIFVITFVGKEKRLSKSLWGFILVANVFAAFISGWSDVLIQKVGIADGIRTISFSSLYPMYIFYIIGLLGWGFYILLKMYHHAKGIFRAQLQYVFLGSALTAIGGITTNLIMPWLGEFRFFWMGPLFSFFMVVLFTYAIIRHHLLNVRVIATEIFTALILLAALSNIILSDSTRELAVNSFIFILIFIFGILLIRQTLREMRALQELSDAKSEFISIASHQLRAPLTAVKGYVSMLIEGTYGNISEEVKNTLQKVSASNERLVQLVNDLLGASRIEEGKLMYSFERVSIPDMIGEVVEELKISADMKDIGLIWKKPPNSQNFFVRGDLAKLRQVILNLIDNGIKYTKEGKVEIYLARDIKPLHLRISVRDTGIGVSKEDLNKIFNRFSRGKEGMKVSTDGMGLGLFIAKRITEDHGGHIWVESNGAGKGSTFNIRLPIYREKASANN